MWFALKLQRLTLKLLEKRVRWKKGFQTPKWGLPAAVTEEDKSKLRVEEEDLSHKPWIHLLKAEPHVGQWPVVLWLIQATECPETGSAASPGLYPGYTDKKP